LAVFIGGLTGTDLLVFATFADRAGPAVALTTFALGAGLLLGDGLADFAAVWPAFFAGADLPAADF
jgi:hypothetical protein